MKKLMLLIMILLPTIACGATPKAKKSKVTMDQVRKVAKTARTGDIIYQYTNSRTSKLVKHVTNSYITHVGVVIHRKGKPYVFEATGPVKFTSLRKFLRKSKNGWFIWQRPKTELSDQEKRLLTSQVKMWKGKSYDKKFAWGDKQIYCSELVYKMYKNIGIDLGEVETFGDIVGGQPDKNSMLGRYISKVYGKGYKLAMDEKIITPYSLYGSDKMETIVDTFPTFEVSGP